MSRRPLLHRCSAAIVAVTIMAAATLASAAETHPVPLKATPGHGDYMFGLASGPSWSTEFAVAGQLAGLASLGQEEGPHGESGPQLAPLVETSDSRAVTDLLTSPTTDLAILPLPTLDRAARDRPGFKARVGYVAPLYLEEVHVIARQGTASLDALAGRTVAVGAPDGVGAILFDTLKIKVEAVDLAPVAALDALRAHEIDAVVLVSGRPVQALSDIGPEAGLQLVPIPYAQVLESEFLPARFGHEDYPGLVGQDAITSVAVPAVLAGYRWPKWTERGQALASLVSGLLRHLDASGGAVAPRKVGEINWAGVLPGWQRLDAAQRWVDTRTTPPPVAGEVLQGSKAHP